ncbi:MAG: tRNA pseudouridine(38-40) synthase TruA [Deltaproteobacteria bacterium]|nr:tRNA pseudouridine(38-40) synthase TruA [Deltaproteobacteria bacterium]
MIRLKLFFSYDGSKFNGWQRQKNTGATIQETFESRFSRIANTRVHVHSSGRTDTGVHARTQVAHADVPAAFAAKMPEARLTNALNSLLPPSIRVWRIERAAAGFHAQRDVRRKMYVYFIDPNPVQWPHLRAYAWHLRLPLNWAAMNAAAGHLAGRHDFRAFCASDSGVKTTVREIFEARWEEIRTAGFSETRLMAFRIVGNGFLKQMVRGIVGTLVKIGGGRASPELIPELLKTGERSRTGVTAPAHGLWLWDIRY